MIISTIEGEEPKNDVISNDIGTSFTMINNNFEDAYFTMTDRNNQIFTSCCKVRCRGNTSSAMKGKKSYKLVFDEKVTFFDQKSSSKEYVLLNSGYSLNTFLGYYLSNKLEIVGQPQMRFVNLMLNGDWKGIYCLSETADRYVEEDSIFFEETAYWWKDPDNSFRTDHQNEYMKYRLKNHEGSREIEEFVKKKMQSIENVIYSNESELKDINLESFAKWIIVKDLMCNYDVYGANVFYTFSNDNTRAEKILSIGPGWDFDGSFMRSRIFQCSPNHDSDVAMMSALLNHKEFKDVLKQEWLKVNSNLNEDVENIMEELDNNIGEALDQSITLEISRWGRERAGFYEQKEQISNWFSERIAWMEGYLSGYSLDTFDRCYSKVKTDYVINEAYYWGWAFIDEMIDYEADSSPFVIGLVNEERVKFFDNTYDREDISNIYGINNRKVGFEGTNDLKLGEICIVDIDNMRLYTDKLKKQYEIEDFEIIYTNINSDYIKEEKQEGVYYWGWAFADEMIDYDAEESPFVIGVVDKDKIQLFERIYERDDIPAIYQIRNGKVGFEGIIDIENGELCAVDLTNMVLYLDSDV